MQNYIIVMTIKALMCSGIATKVWRILHLKQPIKKSHIISTESTLIYKRTLLPYSFQKCLIEIFHPFCNAHYRRKRGALKSSPKLIPKLQLRAG